MVAINKHIQLN